MEIENVTGAEVQENMMKITVKEFAVIHSCLAETYHLFKEMLSNKDFSRFSEDQLNGALGNIYSTFFKIDKLLEPHMGDLLKETPPQQEEVN